LNPWQQEEVRTALDRAVRENQEFCLIPVLLPGAKRPGESELYDGIKNRHWVQFINSVEEEGAWQRLIGGLQDRQTGHLLFFAIIRSSGTGKSSLAMAGVPAGMVNQGLWTSASGLSMRPLKTIVSISAKLVGRWAKVESVGPTI
jgi:hypothetical protein